MSTVWLVVARSYYDEPVLRHVAATEADAHAWAEANGGLKDLACEWQTHLSAVVLEWPVGSTEDLNYAVDKATAATHPKADR